MIERNVRYISDSDGKISEVILPIATFREMVESLEDKELLAIMKKIESNSPHYYTEEESIEMLDSLINQSEI